MSDNVILKRKVIKCFYRGSNMAKKSKPALERLVFEHKLIKAGHFPNCTTMSKKLEVAVTTVQRDMDFLRDRFMAPIEYDYFHKGFYYTQPFELGMDQMDPDDMQMLTSSKVLISHFEGTPLYDELCSIINFATSSSKDTSMLNRIALPPTSKAIIDKTVWSKIYESMKTNTIIEFDYNGLHRGQKTHRRVHAYQLLLDDGLYYLFGYSEERKAVRMFNLSRIENVVLTEDYFTLPENYDFSGRSIGRFGTFISEKPVKYKIRAQGIARQSIKERLWAEDQIIEDTPDGKSILMTFTSTQEEKILHWILSQGADIEPTSPAPFVEKWKKRIMDMYKLINKK